mgnify:CR=1 FL=1
MPIYLNNTKVEQVRTGVTPSPAGPPAPPRAYSGWCGRYQH